MADKEDARTDFIGMIEKSWTFGLLTAEERALILTHLDEVKLFGTYRQRWAMLQQMYSSFLDGTGFRRAYGRGRAAMNDNWEKTRRKAG